MVTCGVTSGQFLLLVVLLVVSCGSACVQLFLVSCDFTCSVSLMAFEEDGLEQRGDEKDVGVGFELGKKEVEEK